MRDKCSAPVRLRGVIQRPERRNAGSKPGVCVFVRRRGKGMTVFLYSRWVDRNSPNKVFFMLLIMFLVKTNKIVIKIKGALPPPPYSPSAPSP